mmetsp:Transcript_2214/g.5932  ORF Transcript_2214/g.5932 Transcript_2214/m.5932 type:complete len:108 (-) Transcript_2214:318-641(-)
METGGTGMGGAVFSGGDLEYAGGPKAVAAADSTEAGEEGGAGGDVDMLAEGEIDWLDKDELRLLLVQERIRVAIEAISTRPADLAKYVGDAAVMGVLYSLNQAATPA